MKQRQPPPDAPPPGPPRILVAEDDARTRQSLAFLLQRHGYEVKAVADGQVALEQLAVADPPGIALLDWEMPQLDGIHVARAIRSLPTARYTYLIMVTAHDGAQDVLTALASGVDDYLSKPVDAAQLLARIRSGERVLALERRLADRVTELETALAQVRQLRRLLPLCRYCKKVRDDSDYWQELDTYLHDQAGADFSQCVCPACLEKMAPREPAED